MKKKMMHQDKLKLNRFLLVILGIALLLLLIITSSYIVNLSPRATTHCFDSDGGKNVSVYGTALKGNFVKLDTCLNSTRVSEAYCPSSSKNPTTVGINCQTNYICNNGKCEIKPIECYTDVDCDDSNIKTEDRCNFPGTSQSFCENIK